MTTLTEAPSPGGRMLELLDNHLELAQVECQYESAVARRRLGVAALATLCLVSAFAFIQIVLTVALMSCGLPLYATCLVLALFWSIAGIVLYWMYGQRDARAGEPFEGTRQEMSRSLQWIRKHIS